MYGRFGVVRIGKFSPVLTTLCMVGIVFVRIGKFIPVLTTLCMVGLELLELGNSSVY